MMDAETSRKFEELERHLIAIDQEGKKDRKGLRRDFRHHRQFLNVLVVAFGLFAAGFGAVVGLVHSADTTERLAFEKNLKDEFLGSLGTAEIVLQTYQHSDLDGKIIPVSIEKYVNDKYKWLYSFSFVTKSIGKAPTSGLIYYKVYTDKSFSAGGQSSDEDEFHSEIIVSPYDLRLKEIPGGGFSTTTDLRLPIINDEAPDMSHPHKVLMKVYYGKSQMKPYTFYLGRL